jgi:hypothetical protein
MSTGNFVCGPIFYFIIIKQAVILRDRVELNEFTSDCSILLYKSNTENFIHINNGIT